jgi:hypothetical protein
MDMPAPFSLEGLAEIVRRQSEDTTARFQEVALRFREVTVRFHESDRRIESLAGQVEALLGRMREQGLRITSFAERQEEQ